MAVEFQEWFRLKALPLIRQASRQHFVQYRGPPWFKWSTYQSLCGAVGHVHSGLDPFFMVSQDADSRHSMRYLWQSIDAGKPPTGPIPDRRDIPSGEEGHIAIDKLKNYVPTAPKVPDSVQFAIESVFAPVKAKYYRLLGGRDDIAPADMVWALETAFAEVATPQTIQNCFQHCEDNMLIFRGKEDECVTLGGVKYHCTNGNWLPQCRRG